MGISDARKRKAAALAAERERLARVRREREQGRRDSIWQEFRVGSERIPDLKDAVESAILAAGSSGGETAEKLSVLLDGRLCPEAPKMLLELLGRLPAKVGILHLARLYEIGVPQVAESGGVAALISGQVEPTARALRRLQNFSLNLRLWRDAELVRLGEKPEAIDDFLARAPLALVDDLLDRDPSVSPSGGERADEGENLYLLARRSPEELTDAQVAELGWEEELWRRRLLTDPAHPVPHEVPEEIEILAGVAEGAPAALEAVVDLLSGEIRQMVQQVLDHPGRPAEWPAPLVEEPDLWPVLDHFCEVPPDHRWTEGTKSLFAQWCELRAAQQELMRVSTKAFDFLRDPLRSSTHWVREEAVSMKVYLDLRFSEPGDMATPRRALESLKVLRSENPIVLHNISWLSGILAKDRNNRGPLFNPYLELGVPQGSSIHVWKSAWRELRKELKGRPIELSDVNLAHDMLRDARSPLEGEYDDMYVLPVHPNHLSPPPRVPEILIREPRPMKRRTEPLSQEEGERLRREAMESFIRTALMERTG